MVGLAFLHVLSVSARDIASALTKDPMMGFRFLAEGSVETILGQERRVVPSLHDATTLHDKDLIGMAYGGESVGDHEAGATL